MHRFFSIVNLFPVLFLLVLVLSLLTYSQKAAVEMEEIMINTWSNSATDAALYQAKRIFHMDLNGRVTLDPEEVWTEYKACFLRAANLYSEQNMRLFEGYCPATIIAVNDGYFMRMRVNGAPKYDWTGSAWVEIPGEVQYVWSQKIPYARSNAYGYWADTMNGAYIYGYATSNFPYTVYDPAHAANRTLSRGPFVLGNEGIAFDEGVSEFHNMREIALELVRAMDYMVTAENNSITGGTWSKQHFYLPDEFIWQVEYEAVSFKGMALLNLVQGFDMLGNKPVDFYTIAATQLVEATQYACFDGFYRPVYYDHPKYGNTYGPVDEFGTALPNWRGIMSSLRGRVAHIVSSREQAAKLGYNPDPEFYERFY